jgi:hypothetical protein
MKNVYYAYTYDILQSPHVALNMLKAKIFRLHGKRLEVVNIIWLRRGPCGMGVYPFSTT